MHANPLFQAQDNQHPAEKTTHHNMTHSEKIAILAPSLIHFMTHSSNPESRADHFQNQFQDLMTN